MSGSPSGTGHGTAGDCPVCGGPCAMEHPPVAAPGPASVSPAETPASLNEAVAGEAWLISAVARKATEHLAADPVVSPADTPDEGGTP